MTNFDFQNFKFSIASQTELEVRKQQALAQFTIQESEQEIIEEIPQKEFIPELSAEQFHYLKYIHHTPGFTAVQRDRKFGFDSKKAGRLRMELRNLELIEEHLFNPGGLGKSYKELLLTEKGLVILKAEKQRKNKGKTKIS